MAGSVQGDLGGNILAEFDYNNIILIDPNKIQDNQGRISERLVDHENLVMYANLEAQILPRTKLVLGVPPDESVNTMMSIARINFLRPTSNNYLGTGYYDELTGKDALISQASNQKLEIQSISPDGKAYFKDTVVDQQNVIDNGLLGITSINVNLGSSFIPSVSMQLEDVQGKALFQLGDNSPYAAFFNLPYPQFYLTLKGYFGQAIKYQLNLEKFNARFNTSTGNYSITLEFKGFKFNVLNEVLVSHLLAGPHMYNKRFAITTDPIISNNSTNNQNLINQNSGQQTQRINTDRSSPNAVSAEYVTEKGYQKIVEVYQEYKRKNLIAQDFPEITLVQLMNKLDMFEQNIVKSYPQTNIEPLTNVRNYINFLTAYFDQVRAPKLGSWFFDFLDQRPIVLNDNTRVYFFKKNVRDNPTIREKAVNQIQSIITQNNKRLEQNPTLGLGKPDQLTLENLTYEQLLTTITLNQINSGATASSFFNAPSPTQIQFDETGKIVSELLTPITAKVNNSFITLPQYLFVFEGRGRFTESIQKLDSLAKKKLASFEEAITAELANLVQDTTTGIGFNPTARNVIAVIMANSEGFLRLLDEVHTNAWNEANNPIRRGVIQDVKKSIQNPEAISAVQITSQAAQQNQGIVNGQMPVYPWPQFFVESPDDKRGRYQLRYLGDPSVIGTTQAWDFKTWPEVEFVEEYMKGLILKNNAPQTQVPLENQLTTYILPENAIEFPVSNVVYSNRQEISFFYEIWERQYVTSFYSGYIRSINPAQRDKLINYVKLAETNNIVSSLGASNPFLTFKLKNTPLNGPNYQNFLRTISNNGTGNLYVNFERDIFVTPYITKMVDNPFQIYKTTELGPEMESSVPLEFLQSIATNSSVNPNIMDTYPFSVSGWVQNNMSFSRRSEGNQVYDTSRSMKVYLDRKVLSNFTNLYDYNTNRPITNFSYLNMKLPDVVKQPDGVSTQQMSFFYRPGTQRKTIDFITTEGYINTPSNTNLPKLTTTSILNSPYFINAIQEGVELQRQSKPYPYVSAAYLFLNSLPLSTLRERYITNGIDEQLNYIASTFNKFGALHKMPYLWVLKMGSVWYRYKTYIENNTDILQPIWKNFDYVKNFDPVQSSTTMTYTFQLTQLSAFKDVTLEKRNGNDIEIQVGFYPKTWNDFAYFYNGKNLFSTFSSAEIQNAIDNDMLLYQFPNSSISATQGGINTTVDTWSCIIPSSLVDSTVNFSNCRPVQVDGKEIIPSQSFFILPSFGINANQTGNILVSNQTSVATSTVSLSGNSSMFNGSVRCLWSAPNYGYFNSDEVVRPSYDSYMTKIFTDEEQISPMRLFSIDEYSKIEEIFGVFDKKTLDIMEQEFLNYCRPSNNIKYGIVTSEIGRTAVQIDAISRNFQAFMREAMTLNYVSTEGETRASFFQKAINLQFENFVSQIKNIMEYDVLLRNGNPNKYSRRVFNSFASIGQTTPSVQSPISFGSYVLGSLPSQGGGITLAQSKANYPNQWKALETEVGFSTIPGLRYSDNGSYITDFFIDNNVEFSELNIRYCSQLIKMYATQKFQNPSLDGPTFRSNLINFLNTEVNLQNEVITDVLLQTRADLPVVEQPLDQSIKSAVEGLLGKVEIYNVFKSLNDKWIAGSDFKNRTLFEDILFLDRASRNIGDTIIIDIFGLKNMINKNALNENMSVYTLISGLLMQNNFVVMPLPAYSNFYNVQSVDGVLTPNTEKSIDFANNFWGTFTTVDYRNAGPKMVCFYVGKPSEQLGLPPSLAGVGDDGFDLRIPNNPIVEDPKGKTDYDKSNKVVGFNVDIGIRNQNVFQTFSVTQENGKATSESIASILMMSDQTTGRNVGTQNVSLYNLYKRRAYQCDVTALGNAMIQPTMYFNLRHVPMFNGPYLITDVNHVITAGDFTTNFVGVRQGIYDYPPIDNYLQKINQNLLTKIESYFLQKTETNNTLTTTNQQAQTNLYNSNGSLSAAAENSCRENLSSRYQTFVSSPAVQSTITPADFANKLKTNPATAPNAELQTIIYVLSYVRTYKPKGKNGVFSAYDNNFAIISLDKPLGDISRFFVQNSYSCVSTPVQNGNISLPIAKFESADNYIEFMADLLKNRVSQILDRRILEYYCCNFPTPTGISTQYFLGNYQFFYDKYISDFQEAFTSADSLGLRTDIFIPPPQQLQNPNNQNTTTTALPPACPPTVIANFTPTGGTVGDIISLSGTNLEYIRTIKVGTTTVDPRTIQFVSTNKIKFSVPNIVGITTPTLLPIEITTSGSGVIVAPGQFEFTP